MLMDTAIRVWGRKKSNLKDRDGGESQESGSRYSREATVARWPYGDKRMAVWRRLQGEG